MGSLLARVPVDGVYIQCVIGTPGTASGIVDKNDHITFRLRQGERTSSRLQVALTDRASHNFQSGPGAFARVLPHSVRQIAN